MLAIQYLTEGDVVVPVPAYFPFLDVAQVAGRTRIDVSSAGGLDLGEVEGAFQNGAGSIIVTNPFNPGGYVFTESQLDEVCALGLAAPVVEVRRRYAAAHIHALAAPDGHAGSRDDVDDRRLTRVCAGNPKVGRDVVYGTAELDRHGAGDRGQPGDDEIDPDAELAGGVAERVRG